MKIQRHRFGHIVLEKMWDAKLGMLTAYIAVTIAYDFMLFTNIPLELLGADGWRGALTRALFTLYMTVVSVVRGVIVAQMFVRKERTGRWFPWPRRPISKHSAAQADGAECDLQNPLAKAK